MVARDLNDSANRVTTTPFHARNGKAVRTCELEPLWFQPRHTQGDVQAHSFYGKSRSAVTSRHCGFWKYTLAHVVRVILRCIHD